MKKVLLSVLFLLMISTKVNAGITTIYHKQDFASFSKEIINKCEIKHSKIYKRKLDVTDHREMAFASDKEMTWHSAMQYHVYLVAKCQKDKQWHLYNLSIRKWTEDNKQEFVEKQNCVDTYSVEKNFFSSNHWGMYKATKTYNSDFSCKVHESNMIIDQIKQKDFDYNDVNVLIKKFESKSDAWKKQTFGNQWAIWQEFREIPVTTFINEVGLKLTDLIGITNAKQLKFDVL